MKLSMLKHKNNLYMYLLSLFLIILTVILGSTLFLNDISISVYGVISISLVVGLISIFLIFNYGILGVQSSILIVFVTFLVFTLLKILLVDFDWYEVVAIIIGIVIATDTVIIQLEKTKDNLYEETNFKKAYKQAAKKSAISSLDSNILALLVSLVVFIFGSQGVSSLALALIITLALSLIVMVIINFFLSYLLIHGIKTKVMLKKLIRNWGFNKKISQVLRKVNFFPSGKWVSYFSGLILLSTMIVLMAMVSADQAFGYGLSGILSSDFTSQTAIDLVAASATSLGIVSLYVLIRYDWTYMLAASISLLHDILLTFGIMVMFRARINSYVSAGILLILGLSINDTLTIFSRVKEKFNAHIGDINKDSVTKIANEAIKDVFKKSLISSLIMIVMLLIPLAAGGPKWFITTLIIGSFIGTYSSIFIATYIWKYFAWKRLKGIKKRQDSHFWDTPNKEEQMINGINDFRP